MTQFSCLGKITNVAGVNNVEAAVSEHNLLAVFPGILYGDLQLLYCHHTATSPLFSKYGTTQLGTGDSRRTQLADYQASSQICQRSGIGQAIT